MTFILGESSSIVEEIILEDVLPALTDTRLLTGSGHYCRGCRRKGRRQVRL